jgi:hypothetical protein
VLLFTRRILQCQLGADILFLCLATQIVTEHDVADGKAAVPEQDALMATLAPRSSTSDDLADFRLLRG